MSSRNEYLSGEPNADAVESRRFQLLSLQTDSNLQEQYDFGGQQQQQSMAKIKVINSDSDNDDDIDDELPPPIENVNNNNDTANASQSDVAADQQLNNESLMEQLMKEGLKARASTAAETLAEKRKNAQKSSFGSFKRGFLNASRVKEKTTSKKTTSVVKKGGTQKSFETLPKPNHMNLSTNESLRLDQVQDAMNNQKSPWEKSLNEKLTSPQLLDRLSKNQIVCQRMTHPKYTAALEALQRNPKEAMEKFQHHPDVMEFIREIYKELGEYFTNVGKHVPTSKEHEIHQVLGEEEIGPLAYNALQREKDRMSQDGQPSKDALSKEEQERLDAILKDEEMTKLLMDVDLQRVMKECSDIPGKAQMYLQHDLYGAKLKRLIQAGLLKFG